MNLQLARIDHAALEVNVMPPASTGSAGSAWPGPLPPLAVLGVAHDAPHQLADQIVGKGDRHV